MLCEIIREIVGAFAPVDKKLALAYAVTYPIKTHVHGFGSSLFDGFVGDTGGTGVVGLDRCRCLWMSHVSQRVAQHGGFLPVVEKGCEFGFGGGGKDSGDNGGVDVDGAIGGGRCGVW